MSIRAASSCNQRKSIYCTISLQGMWDKKVQETKINQSFSHIIHSHSVTTSQNTTPAEMKLDTDFFLNMLETVPLCQKEP